MANNGGKPEEIKDKKIVVWTLSRQLGARLVRVKGKRMFLDELPEDAKGNSMKNMNFECGIFCEVTN
jgi:hypothetical protein